MNMLTSLRLELLKTRRTASWYFTLISALVIPVLFVLSVCANGISPKNMQNPLIAVYVEGFKGLNLLILPMFVNLLCTLLAQIEYRNHTWKQVFVSPQSMVQVFFSKFLQLQLMIGLFLLIYLMSTAISTMVISLMLPSIRLFDHPMDWGLVCTYGFRTYMSVFALSAVQFALSLKIRNFIAPVGIGFVLWIIGNLLVFEVPSPVSHYFPFSYSTMMMFPRFETVVPQLLSRSAGFGVLFLVAGYLLFTWRKARI